MMLHINAVDHDAVPLKLDAPPTMLGQGQAAPPADSPCWLAVFPQLTVGAGVHALQFSVRDEDLEPVGLEPETCRVELRPEHAVAPELVRRDDAVAEIVGGDGSQRDQRCPLQPVPCMPETPDVHHPASPAAAAEQREAVWEADDAEERDSEWGRFERFKSIVCTKCEQRGVECGCQTVRRAREEAGGQQVGRHHPAFDMLSDFMQDMLAAREHAKAGLAQTDGRAKRVILHLYKQGLGNQLLALVNALLLALVTKRLLAVHVHTAQAYDLEPVLDINAFANGLTAPCSNYITVDMAEARGLEMVMCGQILSEDFNEAECLVLEGATADVHLWQANPHLAPLLNSSFGGLPFFFLSHFLHLGTKALDSLVSVKTLPVPQHWDGERTLRDAVQLVSASTALVVGMHVRTTSNIPYLHFDLPAALQRRVASRGPGPHGADEGEARLHVQGQAMEETHCPGGLAGTCVQTVHGCGRDSTVLMSMSRCLEALRVQAGRLRDGAGEAGGDGEQDVVVVWASDHDILAEPLLRQLVANPHVSVVLLEHLAQGEGESVRGKGDRHDGQLHTALLDLELFGAVRQFLGTVFSTFTFAAHARALLTPYYSSFLPGPPQGAAYADGQEGMGAGGVGQTLGGWSSQGGRGGGRGAKTDVKRFCVAAGGSEAGLLYAGRLPSGCAGNGLAHSSGALRIS